MPVDIVITPWIMANKLNSTKPVEKSVKQRDKMINKP